MSQTEQFKSKRYRFLPSTLEALNRLSSIDEDLSENQVVGRLIRNADHAIRTRLRGEALEKYKNCSLSRPEYNDARAEDDTNQPGTS